MLEFIKAPLIIGIVCAAIYGLFELFVRKKERLAIIEKIGDKLDASAFDIKIGLPHLVKNFSFSSLKAGCLLAGIGLGLLLGFFISMTILRDNTLEDWWQTEIISTVFGASVLLCGGIGLIIAFIVEMRLSKDKEKEKE